VKEYDIYVPLHYNDGAPVEPEKITRLKQRLIEQFGGLTHFPQSNEGFWKVGRVTFRDKIIILRVLTSDETPPAAEFFSTLKSEMQRDWRQDDVLIVGREVMVV
jgi:hypothetical protein